MERFQANGGGILHLQVGVSTKETIFIVQPGRYLVRIVLCRAHIIVAIYCLRLWPAIRKKIPSFEMVPNFAMVSNFGIVPRFEMVSNLSEWFRKSRNGSENLGMVPKLVQNNYETRSKLLRSWFRKCRNGSEKSCRDDKFGDWEQD